MRNLRSLDEVAVDILRDRTDAAEFLNAAAEDGDPEFLLTALGWVARAHGLSKVAKKASMSRMGLYKALSKNGNPKLQTFMTLLKVAGVRMSFVVSAA